MIIDLGKGAPRQFSADVAVVGAGAAGQAVARRLLERGLSVLLLESGGFDYEAGTADLNRGTSVGQPYYELEESRLRFFGGTTAIWGGRAAELDPIDFERREWVPWSGWPVGHDAMGPYYREARRILALPETDPGPPAGPLSRLSEDELCVRHWLIDLQFDRFGRRRNADLLAHPGLTLLLHATAREIIVRDSAAGVSALDVCGPGGERHEIAARHYVLAAGGLENPRLLLASNTVRPQGLGNDKDLVGRFFMEHPHGRGGRMLNASAWRLVQAFRKRSMGAQETGALLAPSRSLQSSRRILNSALTVAVRPPNNGAQPLLTASYLAAKHKFEPTERGRTAWKAYKTTGRYLRKATGPLYWWGRKLLGRGELVLVIRGEQAPNPESRVSLVRDNPDATGMPRLQLDWRLQPLDRDSAAELVAAFGREARRLGLGEVEPSAWLSDPGVSWVSDPLVSVHPLGGYHHMGTTRMADDPATGVTDGWGRVHGIDNLFVAGSSLFPTSGWANPTLTILALALRTADRIASLSR
ncbi:MAG TPA: GMC family oxidoreductase [Sphingomicrobium sp.]|jgi:choline dehydrogenase-like flavoprotein|nr:GMC family oxidoreductase [Sphingomicrobium sp.]